MRVPGLVSVRVELRNVCPGVNETGFGENAAVTPEGSPDAVRAAVNAPELPPPLPRLTVIEYVAVPPVVEHIAPD